MHVRMYVYVCVCDTVYDCVHVRVCVYESVCMHIRIYVCVCVCACMYECVRVCM
jgi:hypothetical protein